MSAVPRIVAAIEGFAEMTGRMVSWLTLALVPVFGFAALFIVLAVLAVLALVLLQPRGMEEVRLKP